MRLRPLVTTFGLSATLLLLGGSFSIAQAHPSCSSQDYTNGAEYNYAYPTPTHTHASPKEQWLVDYGASVYGAPGADLVYRVSAAAPWYSPAPWYPPYKSVNVWCPNFNG